MAKQPNKSKNWDAEQKAAKEDKELLAKEAASFKDKAKESLRKHDEEVAKNN